MTAKVQSAADKNSVEIGADSVDKHFRAVSGATRRYRCEVRALMRLARLDGVPVLLDHSSTTRRVVAARIDGVPLSQCAHPPDSVFISLRKLVDQMIERGVARHLLPARDVIVRPDGRAALVDFERVTFRWYRFGPIWLIACAITRFHLLRLIAQYGPHLLSREERRRLEVQFIIRNAFRRIIDWRLRFRKWRSDSR